MVYMRFKKYMDDRIDFQPLELAGRGKRFSEPFYNSIYDAAYDIYEMVKEDIDTCKCAFWGHSMGCLILFELVSKLIDVNKHPVHIFLSGRQAPHISYTDKKIHHLSDGEFKNEVLKYNGTPKELFECKDLADIFLPILRADFKIVEEYKYIKDNNKINSDLTIMFGKYDNMNREDAGSWAEYTKGACKVYELEGDHFFIFEYEREVADIINKTLSNIQADSLALPYKTDISKEG